MTTIKEDYVSFEIAKLLKEKGFNEPIRCWYDSAKDFHESGVEMRNSDCISPTIMCPTHQMAMKWLRGKYDLHIIVYPYKANNEKKWCCQVYKTFNLLGYEKYIDETLNSYEEAVEAALKYVLENLI